jgi:hypothetical protein
MGHIHSQHTASFTAPESHSLQTSQGFHAQARLESDEACANVSCRTTSTPAV